MLLEFKNQTVCNPNLIFQGDRTFGDCFRFILKNYLEWKEIGINNACKECGVASSTIYRQLKKPVEINFNLFSKVLVKLGLDPVLFKELTYKFMENATYDCVIFTSSKVVFSRSMRYVK